jgi:hypothetical protein
LAVWIERSVAAADSNFDDAQERFREFLAKNGYPTELIWVTPNDVLLTGRKLIYVKLPVPKCNLLRARELFELGMPRQLGVSFRAVCEFKGVTCCYVWVPADQSESQHAFMPRDLKMSANTGESKVPAMSVNSQTRWHCLKIVHRNKQALKDQLFWG